MPTVLSQLLFPVTELVVWGSAVPFRPAKQISECNQPILAGKYTRQGTSLLQSNKHTAITWQSAVAGKYMSTDLKTPLVKEQFKGAF